MFSFLLIVIYLAFISLGLPDSLLGSAWPVMYSDLNVPLSYMGILSMIIAIGTIISSLMTATLARKLGTGKLTAISVATTAISMFGFSITDSFIVLCVIALPYGLGAGAVDASLNNYVSLNYAPRHMSWLHCFWGVGTVISPYIMGYFLTSGSKWQTGYLTVSIIQAVLAILIAVSIPFWHKNSDIAANKPEKPITKSELLKTKGVPFMLVSFFCYCSAEATAGMWASSYLCEYRGINEERSARLASMFYIGITVGRLLSGFITEKLGDKKLIRGGLLTLLIGIIMVIIPTKSDILCIAGLIVIGLGSAPVYPSLMNVTPKYFGKEKSLAVVGLQLASAYIGINFMPTLFGFLTDNIWNGIYPFYLLVLAVLLILMTEMLNKSVEKANLEIK